ncbi:ABC transporter substrate-binding protein [Salinarchaeum sp. Harcht-Bsk1]|uniref:ABC transporter substrate-binding protein n=1 Tax=Salinarchaeum sp. Harcht-Bsk1 TaxID=1333523 RepID=UPI0006775DDA|nr:ABC transporter substrate-binding protein [Salinarchaeum sp. Harcht-Bsk1]
MRFTVRNDINEISDHTLARHYNWSGYEVSSGSSEVSVYDLLIAGESDGISDLFTTSETREQFPETMREITFPAGTGLGLWFDPDSEPWNHRSARQALLHAIDRDAVLDEIGSSTSLVDPTPTGLSAATRSNWSLPSDESSFLTYDGGMQRAESLLTEIGYEPDELDVTIAFPEQETSWGLAVRSIEDQFDDTDWTVTAEAKRGDPADLIALDGVDLVAARTGPEPRVQRYHPFFAFEFLIRGDPDADEHFAGYEAETVAVDDTEIDANEELSRLRTTASRAEQRPIAERLALTVNRDLPCAFVFEDRVQSFIDTERFAIPDSSEHLHCHWPQWWLPKVSETLPEYETPGLLKYQRS